MTRELDTECARALGHTVDEAGEIIDRSILDGPRIVFFNEDKSGYTMCPPVPAYSTDYDAVRLLEDEIERRGLQERYIGWFYRHVCEDDMNSRQEVFAIIRATPEQKARAFVETIK